MITQAQARALLDTVEYRDWKIGYVAPDAFSSVADMMRVASVEAAHKVPVRITYMAADSSEESGWVTNDLFLALPLTETEAQFARVIYEAISVIEEHERREFFRVGKGVIDGTIMEKRSPAIFHPHGIRRNKMFHDLDPFAKAVRIESLANGAEMTADAVA